MDSTKILTLKEIATVVRHLRWRLRRRRRVQKRLWGQLVVFRLACCCGLRVSEIARLRMADVICSGPRPAVRVRRRTTKGKTRGRLVPLWWDAGTREDLRGWYAIRLADGAQPHDLFVVSERRDYGHGKIPLQRSSLARRFKRALKCLGKERQRQLHIHCGRHTFCSQALRSGRSLVQVRDAAGHASIATTSLYLHSVEVEGLPDVFQFPEKNSPGRGHKPSRGHAPQSPPGDHPPRTYSPSQ